MDKRSIKLVVFKRYFHKIPSLLDSIQIAQHILCQLVDFVYSFFWVFLKYCHVHFYFVEVIH